MIGPAKALIWSLLATLWSAAEHLPAGETLRGGALAARPERQLLGPLACPRVDLAADGACTPQGLQEASLMCLHSYGGCPGQVLRSAEVTAIFWGPSWQDECCGGPALITGVDTFFAGYAGSDYARSAEEYYGRNGRVGSDLRYAGHVFNYSEIPAALQPGVLPSAATPIAARMICDTIAPHTPRSNALYAVFADVAGELVPGGYAAFHQSSTCRGVRITWALVLNMTGQPQVPGGYPGGAAEPLASVASVLAHELHEIRTDPYGDAWGDSCRAEVADKCQGSGLFGLTTFLDGTRWVLQQEWSNAAFLAGYGSTTKRGCIMGRSEISFSYSVPKMPCQANMSAFRGGAGDSGLTVTATSAASQVGVRTAAMILAALVALVA